jgi:hypothetical protein
VIDGFILPERDLLRDKGRTTTAGQSQIKYDPHCTLILVLLRYLPVLGVPRQQLNHQACGRHVVGVLAHLLDPVRDTGIEVDLAVFAYPVPDLRKLALSWP